MNLFAATPLEESINYILREIQIKNENHYVLCNKLISKSLFWKLTTGCCVTVNTH